MPVLPAPVVAEAVAFVACPYVRLTFPVAARTVSKRILPVLPAALLAFALPAQAQEPAPDLHTIEMIGTPDLRRFTGTAYMRPPASPFTAPVTADGVHRWQISLHIDSLPDPRSLGDYTTYVAWAAPPTFSPMVRLGSVPWVATNEAITTTLEEDVAFNRFTILITLEADAHAREPGDEFVLRGLAPAMRMGAAHMVQAAATDPEPHHSHHADNGWVMPPPHPRASMMYMPGLDGMTPNATPWLPAADRDPTSIPLVRPRELLEPADGDTIRLEAAPARRRLRGRDVVMYAFNGQQPGPLVHVRQGMTVNVNFVNRTELPTAVHWHGIRLDNRFDGVPHLTQEPVMPGDSFHYEIRFPDAGIYWYHPHHREDIQQDLGLYGNLLVRDADGWSPVHREEIVMLDDLLLGEAGLVPYGEERTTHALMGRFGNVLLINGEPAPAWSLDVRSGEVVRFFFTNVANTRTFNVSFPGARMKVVGSDIGRYEQEAWVESVVIAPAERYVVDVAFDSAGTAPLLNRVQAIDHAFGVFFPEEDTLGVVRVADTPAEPDYASTFDRLRRHEDVVEDVARYREHFTREPDLTLTLTMKDEGLPFPLVSLMRLDTLFFNPVEWSGTMPMMDWLPTSEEVTWTLRDEATGLENEEITWQFEVGDLVRIRMVNDRHTLHAMAHPIHIHGQRFLVLDVNGRPTTNHVWKDTVLIPVGGVVELLLEVTNPGMWMIHCHIAEHLEAGMKTVFAVQPG